MKAKFLQKLLLIGATIAVCAFFTGCEPNVPAGNDTSNSLNNTLGKGTGNNTGGTTSSGTSSHTTTSSGTSGTSGVGAGAGVGAGSAGGTGNNNSGVGAGAGAGAGNNPSGTGNNAAAGGTPSAAADYADTDGYGDVTGESNQMPLAAEAMANVAELPNKTYRWGNGRHKDELGRPIDAVEANRTFAEYGAAFVGENEKRVYLTFDEGYEYGCTGAILDTLKEKGVRATFFVTYDFCFAQGELISRMINEGHVVGNHSASHPSMPECSDEQARDEIQKLHDYVKHNFDYDMTLFRFPRGEFSERTLAIAKELGYKSVFWSFAYKDWIVDEQPEVAESLEKIKESLHPGEIVLLHAVSETNTALLGDLIDYWHGQGYKLSLI